MRKSLKTFIAKVYYRKLTHVGGNERFLLMVLHTKKESLLTTIIATTGPRKTQMKWSSVDSQHLLKREKKKQIYSMTGIILEYSNFLECNLWNPSVNGESKKENVFLNGLNCL